jgi:16S rRNA (cytosine967-C5)-methyltransferase
MKYDNQLRYAIQIIETFNGKMPLHNWLKDFFKQHKQMGSKDRKQASEMVYCFYRLGHAIKKSSVTERILTGMFLCNHSSNEILQYFKPLWNEQIGLTLREKISVISEHAEFKEANWLEKIFPWPDQVSDGIDHISFCSSFLQQQDLFIRLRPGFESEVKKKLDRHSVSYREINSSCLAFANTTKLDELIAFNKEAVIQDLNSQKTDSFFETPYHLSSSETIKAWDCCAGSGGKSIMLHDLYPEINITVSDIRESILLNLKKRFKEAGIKKYRTFTADLGSLQAITSAQKSSYDLIIADVPCSGSGTWGRNPDAVYFFDIKEVERYQSMQKKIISNIVPHLKKGALLVYITCSVFKKENEEMADFIRQNFNLRAERTELLKGYDQKADSLFISSFIA